MFLGSKLLVNFFWTVLHFIGLKLNGAADRCKCLEIFFLLLKQQASGTKFSQNPSNVITNRRERWTQFRLSTHTSCSAQF
jgi:hypothetical protein